MNKKDYTKRLERERETEREGERESQIASQTNKQRYITLLDEYFLSVKQDIATGTTASYMTMT